MGLTTRVIGLCNAAWHQPLCAHTVTKLMTKRAELAFPKSAGSFQLTGSSGGHGLAPAILSHSCDLKQCSHDLSSEPISEPCGNNPLLSYHISSLRKITLRLREPHKNLASWQLHYMQKELVGDRTLWPVSHIWSLLTSILKIVLIRERSRGDSKFAAGWEGIPY